jgi:GTP pyrophosphokinase
MNSPPNAPDSDLDDTLASNTLANVRQWIAPFVPDLNSSDAAQKAVAKPIWFDNGVQIARILQFLGCDNATTIAAVMFGMPDLSDKTQESMLLKIKQSFGEDVTKIIVAVRNLHSLRDLSAVLPQDKQLETLRRMLLAMVTDQRVALIYLASRLERLRQYALAKEVAPLPACYETFQVLSPLANRLGLWQLKWELEDLAFRFSEPLLYKSIARQLDEKRIERAAFVESFKLDLEQLVARMRLRAEVAGRPKHIYSIHKKMQAKKLPMNGLSDLHAFRVLVNSVKDCYGVLSVVHERWEPVASEYDDYISRPKANGYQSLHTVVLADDGRRVEVQIRTFDMHQFAEFGMASHWRYKESNPLTQGGVGTHASNTFGKVTAADSQDARVNAMRQLLAWQSDVAHNISVPESTHIYAMTPQGKVIELPQGATPIDFAYHVHSNLGHRCRGAKVNGQLVPLSTKLCNGQTVDIIVAKQSSPNSVSAAGPSRDWLNPHLEFLASARAKTKVRQWFNAVDEARILAMPVALPAAPSAEALPSAQAVTSELLESLNRPRPDLSLRRRDSGDILVVGVDFLMTQLAKCCRPLPPDLITGFVTRAKGISIHRQNCKSLKNMAQKSPERLLPSTWGSAEKTAVIAKSSDKKIYPAELQVHAYDRQGLLRDVSDTLAREKINVTSASTQSRDQIAYMRFTVEVSGANELASAIQSVLSINGVFEANRRG